MTSAELAEKLLEAAAILQDGGDIWDATEWAEVFTDAAEALDDCD